MSFPDVPGANTCGDDRAEALEMAEDALAVALAGHVHERWDIPVPSPAAPGQVLVAVPPLVAAKLALYSAMREQGMTKTALAERLGLSESVDRLLNADHRSHIRASCEKRVRPSFCLRPRGERGSADGTQRSQDDSDRHCGRGAGAAGVHGACLPVMRASTREEMRRISSTSRSSSRLFSIHSR